MSTADPTGDTIDRAKLPDVFAAVRELAEHIARASDDALLTGEWDRLAEIDLPAAHATLDAVRRAARADR